MNALEAYQIYVALKLHFAHPDYDFFKYHGKVKADAHSFESRRDRYFFEKLAKHRDVQGFLVSNLVSGSRSYIRDLSYGEEAKKVYASWLKVKESLTYVFTNEISQLASDFNSNFICRGDSHPLLLRLFLGKKISLETLCIMCDIAKCLPYWDKQMNDVVYEDTSLLIKKYTPFITYDKDKFRKIVVEKQKERSNQKIPQYQQ